MRVLFAVCSWGLGHLMRSLPLIKKLSKENEIVLVAHGKSLVAARKELKDYANIKFIDVPDYPLPYTKNPLLFLPKFAFYTPKIFCGIRREHNTIEKIIREEGVKKVISDNRYGAYSSSKKVPSYFLIHQLKYKAPFGTTSLTELFNSHVQRKFNKILVPDFPEYEKSLAGELSHNLRFFEKENIKYLGVLSDYKKRNLKKDIDVFISVSGPEPQRSIFEEKILEQSKRIKKKVVISLGDPERKLVKEKGNLKIYSYLSRERRENLLNRSRIVVSRSGYSTLMDLAEIGNKALFIPTKNQTEQEYLAKFHQEKGNAYSKDQGKIDLKEDLKKAKRYKGFKVKWKTKESLEIFLDEIS